MAVKGCSLLSCLITLALIVAHSHGQSASGFISVDCGIPEGKGYKDTVTSVDYSSDEEFVDTGENKNVSSDFISAFGDYLDPRYLSLRSFPNGTRNCYTLRPVERGKKYLLRAGFLYGNYDGLNQPPAFDLHLGVNLWTSVNMPSYAGGLVKEIIAVAPADSVSVCLVNTGSGAPFVSLVELRPFPDGIYPLVNESQSLVLFEDRRDYGGRPNGRIRYPDDPYDRHWFAPANSVGWTTLSTQLAITNQQRDEFQAPPAVMRTAVTTAATSGSLDLRTAPSSPDDEIYVFLLFAELNQLGENETRELDVYLNGQLWSQGFAPQYLVPQEIYTATTGSLLRHDYSIRASNRSTLPPILNAIEVYALNRLTVLPTDGEDVDAILNIKASFQIKRNWEGDPCAPQNFSWEDLNCSYESSPRIISLNLTSSGLTGGIPPSIANLTNLRSLDLSKNNLIGAVPEFLADLPFLQILNLSDNKLTGVVPWPLYEKSLNGSLLLSLEGNTDLCYNMDSCHKKKKKRNFVPIIIATSIILVVVTTLFLIWALKRRRYSSNENNHIEIPLKEDSSSHLLKHTIHESQQFTFVEIVNITNNFEKEIGRGGFGVVFCGYLKNGAQVAVKMLSKLSSQGEKEFRAEVLTLMRVHHKNLVSLLGYCDEKDNLALVYEYMAQGCLLDHLRGNASNDNNLSWRVRMQIALEAAQGLEYLHSGCKPPIVHRDVKTANILLNQKFEAKIADFGLSRAFGNDGHSHISTTLAGTLGYLDPEYHHTIKLNEKSDVFSFGVVLLELITGQPPIIDGKEKTLIAKWVHPKLQRGDIDSIVDPNLRGEYDVNSLWRALEVAMACVSSTHTQRPTMNDVVMQLKDCLTPYIVPVAHDSIPMVPIRLGLITNPTAR